MTLDELDNLPGHISKGNILTLQKYLNHGIVVDIGTCAGKSAISEAVAGAQVQTCDPFPNPQAEELIKPFDITLFKETSEEFAKHCPEIDGCFIDGVHNYLGVKTDIEGIVTKVKKGGYVLFHDCNLYSNTIRVAVDEFNGKLYEFIEEVGGRTEDPKEGSMWVGRRL